MAAMRWRPPSPQSRAIPPGGIEAPTRSRRRKRAISTRIAFPAVSPPTPPPAMNIHEYQGKEIFRKFGVPTPRGFPAFSVDEAVDAAKRLGGLGGGGKTQNQAGGRGEGGGREGAQ